MKASLKGGGRAGLVSSLRNFALVADGERGALLDAHGSVVWLCAPRWHDDAVMSSLVGGDGTYTVAPVGRWTWGGHYEPGTLIWRSRWVTDDCVIESRDALAYPGDVHRVVVLRTVRAVGTTAHLRVRLDVRGGFGRRSMRQLARDDSGTWHARTGDLRVRWEGAGDAVEEDGALVMDLVLRAGESRDLVLEISDVPLPDPTPADQLWDTTTTAWAQRVPHLEQSAAPRDARLAGAVLCGLTSSSSGMVAAATLGIPERALQGSSFDYRYAWVRDQCYAGIAAGAAGMDDLLDSAVSFVTARLLEDGPRLRPAYLVDGGRVPDQRKLSLPGYPGAQGIAGNHANDQFQLDAFGEALRLLAAAASANRLDTDGWRAALVAVEAIERRWDEPGAGIWELEPAWWTHSRLACVAGLRRIVEVAPNDGHAQRLGALADAVLARTTETCLHPDGHWQRSPDRADLDVSLVWPAIFGALPADDPRTRATLAAVERDLTVDGYAYRFRTDDRPLGEVEGAFLLCGFMLSLAYAHQGDDLTAFRWFERNRAACGTPGLFTEEYDVQERELRGNVPQAFVHAAMLQTAVTLGRPL